MAETTQVTTPKSKAEKIKIAFFGTPEFSVIILDEMKAAGLTPSLIITNPDKPSGRKLVMTPTPTKVWALKEGVAVRQPEDLKNPDLLNELRRERWDMFIVAAYGKLIPRDIIELPLHNTLNVHPSLLPKYRGSSPIHSAILADDSQTGVSIMIIDEQMDHGPVLASQKVLVPGWPPKAPTEPELEELLAHTGGKLLSKTIPLWIDRSIEAIPQDHHKATYTKKITKADGEIDLQGGDPYQNFLKIQAFAGWPGAYFFENKDPDASPNGRARFIIKKAAYENGKLTILRVVPEGKKETDYRS